jgi:hypothetical protein
VDARDFHNIFEKRPTGWTFNKPYPESTIDLKDGQVRLTSPGEVDLVLEEFVSDQGKHGVLLRVHNQRITNIANCNVVVHDVRSYDLAKGAFRESSGFKPVRILRENCAAGFETRNAWLVRIEGDHLEVGDTIASGILQWPSGDRSAMHKWRLRLSVAIEGSPEWTHEVDAEWERGSTIIRLGTL